MSHSRWDVLFHLVPPCSSPSLFSSQEIYQEIYLLSILEYKSRLANFWRASFSLPRKAIRFLLGSWVTTETRHAPQLIGFLLWPWVDFLRTESFWNLSYPVLLQPESRASPGQGANPQAGWGMSTSWRSNPRARQGMSASQELGPWAGWDRLTSWDPQAGVWHPQGLQHD